MNETVLTSPPVQPRTGMKSVIAELFDSRLFVALTSLLIVYLHIVYNGYECFRSDHITQIPLIYMKADQSLYKSDWFLQQFAHMDVRQFHLFLIRLFSAPLGLPGGILALFLVLQVATVWAWAEISKKIFNSPLPGLITAVAAVYCNGIELGSNHLLEKIMIPRTEAFAFAYWGLFCLLIRRPRTGALLGGVLMGLSAYCQMAVGGLFALPMLIWMMLPGRGPRRWQEVGCFLSGFALVLAYPLLTVSKGFMTTQTVSDAEAIHLSAFIRHPHHMIPHGWGGLWLAFALLAALAGRQWRRMKHDYPQAWSLGWLGVIIMDILAVSTIFIEIIPVKNVIMGQPYRMAVLLYFVLLMLFSPHLLGLLSRPDLLAKTRAVLLCLGLDSWRLFSLVALAELIISTREAQGRPLPVKVQWALLLAAALGAVVWDDEQKGILKIAVILLGLILLVQRFNLLERPRLVWASAAGLALAAVVWTSSFFWMPYQKLIDDEESKDRKKTAQRCYSYQFKPIPIMALERLGAWAEQNTPKDALFVIPPEREQYGFHLWAKRSAVFAFKFFPYKPAGLAQWKERFLASRGIFETLSEAGRKAAAEAMNDRGGELVNNAFFALTAEQMLKLADTYHAGYVITQAHYLHPGLRQLTSDFNRTKSESTPYRLYQVVKNNTVAKPL